MPKRVLLSLNGLILMEGNIERFEDKNSFMDKFESLRPDLFFPDEWTDEQKEKAVDLVRPQKTRTSMFSSVAFLESSVACLLRSVNR